MAAPPRYSATITIDNPEPHRGDTIIATVKTDAPASAVELHCFQGDDLVARSGWTSSKGPEYTEDFGLSSGIWPAGSGAECTLTASYWDKRKRVDMDDVFEFEVLP